MTAVVLVWWSAAGAQTSAAKRASKPVVGEPAIKAVVGYFVTLTGQLEGDLAGSAVPRSRELELTQSKDSLVAFLARPSPPRPSRVGHEEPTPASNINGAHSTPWPPSQHGSREAQGAQGRARRGDEDRRLYRDRLASWSLPPAPARTASGRPRSGRPIRSSSPTTSRPCGREKRPPPRRRRR